MEPVLRRATERVATTAASLILQAAPGLELLFDDRDVAVRAAEAVYRADRTELAHRFGMLAEVDRDVAGLAIAFPGRLHGALKLGTGVVLARAAGPRHVADLARRGRVLDRLLPGVDRRFLYVSCLAVAEEHRRTGIATRLMERVIAGARRLGLGVALDVGIENERARKLYEGLGFHVASIQETTETQREVIPTEGSLRMELPPTGTTGGS